MAKSETLRYVAAFKQTLPSSGSHAADKYYTSLQRLVAMGSEHIYLF